MGVSCGAHGAHVIGMLVLLAAWHGMLHVARVVAAD